MAIQQYLGVYNCTYISKHSNKASPMDKCQIEIMDISPEKIKFALSGCDVSLVNALRRILISQVPTLAPHLVSIIQNTSVLHDEFLCQRIGLIPFISDMAEKFKYPWECMCSSDQTSEDCRICKAYFVLQAKNVDQQVMEITSLDIRSVYEEMRDQTDSIRPIKPVQFFSDLHKEKKIGIPIVKLARNQQINIRFDVQKGIGKMHSKWAPCSLATFHPDPQIKIDDTIQMTINQKKAISESCPAKVFDVREGIFQVVNQQKCIYCGQCKKTSQSFDLINFRNFINIGKKKDRYIFTVQSVGQLRADYIMKQSFIVLRKKLQEIRNRID